jgi:hypothetical protein
MDVKEEIAKQVASYRVGFLTFTGKVSDITRQLALAGIGVVWIFKSSDGKPPIIAPELICPTILLLGSLVLDLAHYFFGTLISYYVMTKRESQLKKGLLNTLEQAHVSPCYTNVLSVLFFLPKVILMAMAYYKIMLFLSLKI